MKQAKKIDKVLEYVVNHPDVRLTREQVQKGLNFDNTKELVEILNKLAADRLALKQTKNNVATYVSTFDGRIFFENGGYKKFFGKEKRKSTKDKFMSGLYVVNILAIIILTYLNYKATDKANERHAEVQNLKKQISTLQSTNDSLKALQILIDEKEKKALHPLR